MNKIIVKSTLLMGLTALAGCGPNFDMDLRGIVPGGFTTAGAQATPREVPKAQNTPQTYDETATDTTTASPARAAQSHKVAAGETAWSVARKYGISIQELAQANSLPENMGLRTGQVLTIPAAAARTASAITAPGQGSPTPQPPSAAQPLPDEKTQPTTTPAPPSAAPNLGATRTAASGSGRLAMPVSGAIIRPYQKGRNDGIDISAPAGTPVSAAATGTVAAITRDVNQVPIVVVRHSDGLMTVYAGMGDVAVEKGATVQRGQALGKAGNSGSVHFEVRNGFESLNPEDYLN
ncbi:MAG: peptidoglycan DD-metalloendopeptidase family protein [Paracoccus sp. (in: a-proteobacteria)]|uniref:M23 family metallopeptidase n=1 Tax=Paracoccus sp. TaxID=267 RepID=UPI0026E065ED|nr:M23 family metallopeptidase [Paracoccus sp. (in: a-proteobacteria)]MDO5620557.1 peptidoglycan DD-metalloendopeptidase family protein [Paracoccus sp. (in: a-proteobacteria)]